MRTLHRWQYQYLGATSISQDISQLELDSFFTFSAEEIREIQSRYKSILRIGAAIQLGFLKMTGRPPQSCRPTKIRFGESLDRSD